MKTIRLTMAQALIKFLNNQYVEMDGQQFKFVQGLFGIFGHGNVTGIGQAMEQMKDDEELSSFQFIQGKNEQGMAHAAIAFAKQKNRLQIYACTSSIGPGALNMVTAAGTATVNRIPVLFLPGDTFASRQPDPVLQQVEYAADYTVTANDAFKPVSKYWDRITKPEQLMSAALNAMRVLTDPAETGAVTLCLPQDVQCEAYDYPTDFFNKRVYNLDRRPAALTAVKRAADTIRGKKAPVIICGGGVHYSLALSELKRLAEAFQIPVVETQAGKSALKSDHPLNFGGVGVTGTLAANKLVHEADVVIAVGTRLSDFTTESKGAFKQDNVEVVSINVCSADAFKLRSVPVVADAAEGMRSLADMLEQYGYKSGYTAEGLAALKQAWEAEVERLYGLQRTDGFAQTRAIGIINSFVKDEVVVCAAGSLPGDLHRLWRSGEPKSYHMEYGFSCMGYEVSGSFGVKLAEPEREVYAIVGDGSYLMLHSELVTSLQEGKKITVLLFDNHGFQCIHNLQRGHGSDGFGNEFRKRAADTRQLTGPLMSIDFAAHARSLGAGAYTASNEEELREALRKAKADTASALIHINVLPGTNTDGYDSWWHVGVAEVSDSDKVRRSYEALRRQLLDVKTY